MKKLWAGAIIASDGEFNYCVAGASSAKNEAEAKGILYDMMMKRFPPTEGYTAHALDVINITELALKVSKDVST